MVGLGITAGCISLDGQEGPHALQAAGLAFAPGAVPARAQLRPIRAPGVAWPKAWPDSLRWTPATRGSCGAAHQEMPPWMRACTEPWICTGPSAWMCPKQAPGGRCNTFMGSPWLAWRRWRAKHLNGRAWAPLWTAEGDLLAGVHRRQRIAAPRLSCWVKYQTQVLHEKRFLPKRCRPNDRRKLTDSSMDALQAAAEHCNSR